MLACGAGMEEEDELARSDDPVALWLDDWAADAPWEKYASHTDPVGVTHLVDMVHHKLRLILTVLDAQTDVEHHCCLGHKAAAQ